MRRIVRISAVLDDISASDAVARLRAALARDALPATQKAYARALADRLENGVRVVVLGPQDAGKSALCDAILGGASAPAPRQQTRHFYVDGATCVPPETGIPTQSFSLGFCPFGHVQLLDIGAATDVMGWHEATRAALDFADIVLWCTDAFGSEEASLWAAASDALKDHSFLVLTKADVLAEQGLLAERINALQDVVAEEFHSLLPTTTAQVLQHQSQNTATTDAQFAASGLKALVEPVHGIVSAGQRADLDSALLFLERQGLTDMPAMPSPAAASGPAIIDAIPFRAARDTIMARAYDLAELGFDEAEGDMSEVLELCGTISEELVEVMGTQAQTYPQLGHWCIAFQDAGDKVMLMTLENDLRSAADAVTILLQLRRDLESMQVS
jgi:hypothetical protein